MIPILPSLVSKNIFSSFQGFNYTDVITEKSDFKQQLLSVGVGFDGSINYPICFKAFFNTPEVDGSIKIAYESLFDQLVDVSTDFTTVPSTTSLYIGPTWRLNLTDPKKLSASKAEYDQYCEATIYDPYLACQTNSANEGLCTALNRTPALTNLGNYGPVSTLDGTEQVAPILRDYYFATSYNTWTSATVYDDYAGEPVSCAKFVPIDCLTDEVMPITPLLEEKLIAISDASSQKNDFLSLLTLGAFDDVLNNIAGAQSTNDLTATFLEKLTGTDMLSLNKVLDPTMIKPLDFAHLQSLIESKNGDKTGEINLLKSIIDPLGVLSLGKVSR